MYKSVLIRNYKMLYVQERNSYIYIMGAVMEKKAWVRSIPSQKTNMDYTALSAYHRLRKHKYYWNHTVKPKTLEKTRGETLEEQIACVTSVTSPPNSQPHTQKCIEREYRGKRVGFISNPSLDTTTAQELTKQKRLNAIACDLTKNQE